MTSVPASGLRGVLDTNVYISVLACPQQPLVEIWSHALRRRYHLLVAPALINEVGRILRTVLEWDDRREDRASGVPWGDGLETGDVGRLEGAQQLTTFLTGPAPDPAGVCGPPRGREPHRGRAESPAGAHNGDSPAPTGAWAPTAREVWRTLDTGVEAA